MHIEWKVDPRLKTRDPEDLTQAPVVITVNEFTERSAIEFCNGMRSAKAMGQPVIPVIIDSYGGSTYSCLHMIDMIKESKVAVATIAMGKAMSSGADLLAAGTPGYRYASPNATIMVHESSGGLDDDKIHDLKAEVEEVERLDKLSFGLLEKHCNKPSNYFQSLLHQRKHTDWCMTPEEAKEQGLIDHIRIPIFSVKINVDMVLV